MKTLKNCFAKHDITPLLVSIAAVAIIAGTIYGCVTHITASAKRQAVSRAKNMDGRTFTITEISWNLVGDTKLILQDENGQDAGWVVMHITNPLSYKLYPLFLLVKDPSSNIPLPMKVTARFRETPWTDQQTGRSYEQFTGSFLEFEQIP